MSNCTPYIIDWTRCTLNTYSWLVFHVHTFHAWKDHRRPAAAPINSHLWIPLVTGLHIALEAGPPTGCWSAINWRSSYVSGLSNIDDQLRNPNINQSEAEHLGVACLDAPLTGSLLLIAYSVSFNLSHLCFASNILLSQINISLSGCNWAKCHPHFPFPNKR